MKVSDLVGALISVEKIAGKPVALRLGDVLRAEVVDLLSTGGVTLKIDDSYVTARTEVPVRENSSVFVKVLGSGGPGGKELRLQFLGYAGESGGGEGQAKIPSCTALNGLMRELAGVLAAEEGYARDFTGIAERLLKALPSDNAVSLPKEMRSQLQDLLKAGLGSVRTSIQERVGGLLELLKSDPESRTVLNALEEGLMLEGEALNPGRLKAALENTGVGFEAKLKAFAARETGARSLPVREPGAEAAPKESGTSESVPPVSMNQRAASGRESAGVRDAGFFPAHDAGLEGEPAPLPGPVRVHGSAAANVLSAVRPDEEAYPPEVRDDKPLAPLDAPRPRKSGDGEPMLPATPMPPELEEGRKPEPAGPARMAGREQQQPAASVAGERELRTSAFPVGADLKHALLQLKRTLTKIDADGMPVHSPPGTGESSESADRAGAAREKMLESINGLLRDIEGFQVLSKATDSFCTFLPIVWKELKEGRIAFKRGRAGGKGPSYYCMVNLDFDRIGRLDTMILMQGRDYSVSFKCGNAEFRSILNSRSGELQSIFRRNGMNLGSVSVLGAEDTSLQHFERLESLEGLVNIRI